MEHEVRQTIIQHVPLTAPRRRLSVSIRHLQRPVLNNLKNSSSTHPRDLCLDLDNRLRDMVDELLKCRAFGGKFQEGGACSLPCIKRSSELWWRGLVQDWVWKAGDAVSLGDLADGRVAAAS